MNVQTIRGIRVVFQQKGGGPDACDPPGRVCVFNHMTVCPASAKDPGFTCAGGTWQLALDEQTQDSTIPSMVAP